jgi:hypothetical protein
MRRLALAAALVLLAGPAARADVEVHVNAGRVDLKANAAPLTEILDRLSRQIGMKIVNDGVTPHLLLTLTLENRTPVEAVLGVLEGLGLNYALQMDKTGTNISTLVMAGAPGPGARTAASSAAPPPRQAFVPPERVIPPPASGPEEEEPAVEEQPEEDTAPDENAGGAPGQVPGQPGVPQVPGQQGTNVPGVQPMPFPTEPMFPTSPFTPRPPVFQPPQAPGGPQPQPQQTPQPEKPQ